MKTIQKRAFICAAAAYVIALNASAQCTSQSPKQTMALIELFTSEGCSSCPPAERWLAQAKTNKPGSTVALALHVAYWDYLGWKDVFAKPIFAQRQRWLANLNQSSTVYTPGIFINGREAPNWDNNDAFASTVTKVNNSLARATIKITRGLPNQQTKIEALLDSSKETNSGAIQLHVATTSKPFSNKISAGENKGELLEHAHVVDQWAQPVVFAQSPMAQTAITTDKKTSAVVALVQDTKTGSVLQAFAVPADCAAN
jgi:hypothetical protein